MILPIMLIILLAVGDFGRLFAAGITIESAARNAAEVAAAEYNRNLLVLPIDYAAVHQAAWSSVCDGAANLPNATPGGGGDATACRPWSVSTTRRMAAAGTSTTTRQGSPPDAQPCRPAASNGLSGSESTFVEVRVCYRFNTIFEMTLPSLGGPLQALGGDFFIERSRVFSVADY